MSDNTVAEKTISNLKSKLDAAINARSELEEEFSAQSVLLTGFIDKLSQTCKGIDKSLDNKLAKLRTAFKKSTSFAELELQINGISKVLQQYSVQNSKNILAVHEQIQCSGKSLQKSKNIPDGTRRVLRDLLNNSKETKDSLTQYMPVMSDLISLFESIQSAKKSAAIGLLDSSPLGTSSNHKVSSRDEVNRSNDVVSKPLLTRFSAILDNLLTTQKHHVEIKKTQAMLSPKITHNTLMTNCLNIFDLIVEDLQAERNTAKVFFTTLSETLAIVKASVDSTISSTTSINIKQDKVNKELQEQIADMNDRISDVSSMADVNSAVSSKLQEIADTIAKKNQLEKQQRTFLKDRLETMSLQVEQLEKQSLKFEERIQEQQAKSFQDALTKLSNRAAFDEHFAKEMVRFHHKKFDLAITVVDLDDFKRINDTYGHTAGDKTLQVIANTLTKVIADDAFIGRYGGEEFVLVFSGKDKNTVMKKLDFLRKGVASLPFTFKNTRVSITLSIGVTLVQEDDNVHSAFERADTALYQAKKDGKNRVIYG